MKANDLSDLTSDYPIFQELSNLWSKRAMPKRSMGLGSIGTISLFFGFSSIF